MKVNPLNRWIAIAAAAAAAITTQVPALPDWARTVCAVVVATAGALLTVESASK